uniref:Uncharacterized protein n=1 Tax=Ciona savignyi TaxID=51511 RepID=H2YB83_CIOSA
MKLDVSSLQSVREFVKVFKERADRLDILINNAAVNAAPLSSTEDGLVLTYATNHFGPFLLTNLLLEHMSKSGTETRVVNVGSLSHVTADLDLDYITPHKAKHYIDSLQKNMIKKKDDLLLYQNSKLMVLMFTFELARRLKGRHVTVNCVQPGIVATRMMEDEKHFFRNLIMKLLKPFARGTEDGCQPILHCALSSDLYSVSGKYFGNCVEDHSLHPMALDEQMCKQLWRISENFTRLTDS